MGTDGEQSAPQSCWSLISRVTRACSWQVVCRKVWCVFHSGSTSRRTLAAPCRACHVLTRRHRQRMQTVTSMACAQEDDEDGRAAEPQPEEASPAVPPAAGGGGGDFVAAAAFAGARAGFAFQAGPLGLGYYREGSAAQRAGAPAAAAGAAGAAAAGDAEVRARRPCLCTVFCHWERHARALAPPSRSAPRLVGCLPAPARCRGTCAASTALARALPLMGRVRRARRRAAAGWACARWRSCGARLAWARRASRTACTGPSSGGRGASTR